MKETVKIHSQDNRQHNFIENLALYNTIQECTFSPSEIVGEDF